LGALPGAAAEGGPVDEYQLKVALVFQDPRTRAEAQAVRDRLAAVVDEASIHCTEWRINELLKPAVFRDGAAALADADAIVIALPGTGHLPAVFYLWVNLRLQQRQSAPGALIALVGVTSGQNLAFIETRSYLHAVASQGRLELLFKRFDPAAEPLPDLGNRLRQWSQAA